MVILYKTFKHRKLTLVAVLSVATIVLMLASQVPEILPQNDHAFAGNLVKLVSKTSLIAIFLVLAS